MIYNVFGMMLNLAQPVMSIWHKYIDVLCNTTTKNQGSILSLLHIRKQVTVDT